MEATLIQPSWESIERVLTGATRIVISSPWISREGVAFLNKVWATTNCKDWEIWVRLTPMDYVGGVSDFHGLLDFASALPARHVRVWSNNALHTKLYWGGNSLALVGSSNLTAAGLSTNVEAGVLLRGTPGEIATFVEEQRRQLSEVGMSRIQEFLSECSAYDDLKVAVSKITKGLPSPDRLEWGKKDRSPTYHPLR